MISIKKPPINDFKQLYDNFSIVVGHRGMLAIAIDMAILLQKEFPNLRLFLKKSWCEKTIKNKIVNLNFFYDDNITTTLQQLYKQKHTIIALASPALVLRSLAYFLSLDYQKVSGFNKWNSPPILLLAGDSKTLLPLLGEHHGGQRLGLAIVEICAKLALSYGGNHLPAPDDLPPHWRMVRAENLPSFLNQQYAEQGLGAKKKSISQQPVQSLLTDWKKHLTDIPQLVPPALAVGIGLVRSADADEVEELFLKSLEKIQAEIGAVGVITSIDVKMDELALQKLSQKYQIPLWFFSKEVLETVPCPNRSSLVAATVGSHSVAEAAALLAAGAGMDVMDAQKVELLLPKQKTKNVTLAIAAVTNQTEPEIAILRRNKMVEKNNKEILGQALGQLSVVGLGPGNFRNRSFASDQAVLSASDVVGYKLYLDLAKDLLYGKICHPSELGQEQQRVEHAINLAIAGKSVVLLASGDSGIYAMASLVWQMLDEALAKLPPDSVAYRKIHALPVTVVAGISAFQALSAKIGAPAGNDFAVVSLSDLMTPVHVIQQRVKAAFKGDFVLFLYNPKSRKRQYLFHWVLQEAKIHAANLGVNLKIAIGKNLDRIDEKIIITDIQDINPAEVDMFSLVMIGNSSLRSLQKMGKTYLYAYRGYE